MVARILVIDDEEDIRYLIGLMLEDSGYEVLMATNGQEGLELLRQQQVDLLILDIMMPGLNGWEICKRIRQRPETRDLPVLVLTVRSEVLDIQRSQEAAPDGFMNKPFERQDLLHSVSTLLARNTVSPA